MAAKLSKYARKMKRKASVKAKRDPRWMWWIESENPRPVGHYNRSGS